MTSKPKKNLVAGGGVAIRQCNGSPEVLLIRREGRWDLPKGHLEEPETIQECAVREVEEETGAAPLHLGRFLCDTYHEYRQSGQLIGKKTFWYLMYPDDPETDLSPEIKEGITETSWAGLQEARKLVHFENLRTVLDEIDPKQDF